VIRIKAYARKRGPLGSSENPYEVKLRRLAPAFSYFDQSVVSFSLADPLTDTEQ
jgi:hypothetical protein